MNSEVKTLPSKQNVPTPSWIQTLKKHYELIFAIASGIFILVGWLLTKNDAIHVGITCYILAYIVGGYAKAKEGIEDTIEEKELNVEMLMLFAAIGAAVIGYWAEGAILIFIFALSGAMESYTLSKSQKKFQRFLIYNLKKHYVFQMEPKNVFLLDNYRLTTLF